MLYLVLKKDKMVVEHLDVQNKQTKILIIITSVTIMMFLQL